MLGAEDLRFSFAQISEELLRIILHPPRKNLDPPISLFLLFDYFLCYFGGILLLWSQCGYFGVILGAILFIVGDFNLFFFTLFFFKIF